MLIRTERSFCGIDADQAVNAVDVPDRDAERLMQCAVEAEAEMTVAVSGNA